MPHDQNAADQRIDDVENQGQLHLLLADDGGERITFSLQFLHGFYRLLDLPNLCNLATRSAYTIFLTLYGNGHRLRAAPDYKYCPANSIYFCEQRLFPLPLSLTTKVLRLSFFFVGGDNSECSPKDVGAASLTSV